MGGDKSGVSLLCPKCLRLRELICVSISCGSVMVRQVTQVLGSSVGLRGIFIEAKLPCCILLRA